MNCTEIRVQFPMLRYGELSFDEEEAVESHLDTCADCRAALEQENAVAAAFDQIAMEPSPAFLRESRERLFAQLEREAPPVGVAKPVRESWWDRFIESISIPVAHPASALALVVMGFLGAHLVPANLLPGGFGAASVADFGPGRVRSVESTGNGTVRMEVEEVRQRTVSGSMDDPAIRPLLLIASRDPSEDLRAESVTVMSKVPEASDFRNALVYTVRNDRNAGVRLKALKGLGAFLSEPEVRNAVGYVLVSDTNPAMRIQAIDLMMASLNGENPQQTVDPRIVGALQAIISSEKENPYLREQCQRALELVKASAQVY